MFPTPQWSSFKASVTQSVSVEHTYPVIEYYMNPFKIKDIIIQGSIHIVTA